MTTSAQKIINTAKAQIGYREGRAAGHWNNQQKYSPEVPGLEWSQGQAWCATFVSWCAMQSGLGSLYPRSASCDVAGNWFRTRKQWSEYPAVGAQVFFGTAADLNHTGIVVAFDANTITTVEGNTNVTGSREGDGVYLRNHDRRSARVVGYGYPAFPDGIVSADPRHKRPTRVQVFRAKVGPLLTELEKAPRGRVGVHKMAAAIRAALKSGPAA